jgi:hypothetical protein
LLFVPLLALPDAVLKLPPKPELNKAARNVVKNNRGKNFLFKLFICQSLLDFEYYVFDAD